MTQFKIVDVPVKMQRFYGGGSMLHPSLEQVAEVIKDIPFGGIRTIQQICDELAIAAGSDVTCPMRTGNAIKKMSKTVNNHDLPFWRVIRSNGTMMKLDDQAIWAARLKEEGANLSYTKKGTIRVQMC